MLKTVKKLFGFKVKETEEKVSISTLEHAKKEDHDRILAKARQERADRERRDRERMRTSDSGSDVFSNPLHPLNPISPINFNNFDDDSSTRHRKHDSGFSDGGSPVYHHNTHVGDSGGHSPSSPSGGGDSGGGDGGGGGGD